MRALLSRLPVAVIVALALLCAPHTGSADTAVMLTGFPLLKQQHLMTCEASAASMGTRAALTETQIMGHMRRSPNPYLGYRGNPDGQQDIDLKNYGVYAGPVHRALTSFGYTSTVMENATNADIKASIRKGWPVVLWVTYALKPAAPRLGVVAGRPFVLVPHEHAILGVGFDAGTIMANDPWTGKMVRYRWGAFDRSWGLFNNMALAVDPCPAPAPISGLTLTRANAQKLVWTWGAARNAAQYHVAVRVRGTPSQTLFSGVVSTPGYTLSAPVPGATIEIVVRSVSPCGERSKAKEMWVVVPPLQSSPSPTPTSPVPTSTAVPPTATGTATHG